MNTCIREVKSDDGFLQVSGLTFAHILFDTFIRDLNKGVGDTLIIFVSDVELRGLEKHPK